ncbi:uncharacterized protein N7515_010235 [Penicillium bovifimosum]|uniref:Uncharacterized protein n=1 Tax=Penicillium bovifimosum TaxID=126998 RepID=A0A9W9KUW9_9EURO|nr:uncharacterized protein N7515_010235 [Penicillium bovifimosum]KAJ5120847.1 hypothetical protein N7515_010235 [Penicillium bovifimosum]
MASQNHTLLEYARHYKLAEDSDSYAHLAYEDETFESDISSSLPALPPHCQGLRPENPEQRMGELEYRFCSDIYYSKLPKDPKAVDLLSTCLKSDVQNKNIWRGILPKVDLEEDAPEPELNSAEGERLLAGHPSSQVRDYENNYPPSVSSNESDDMETEDMESDDMETDDMESDDMETDVDEDQVDQSTSEDEENPNVPEFSRDVFELYNSEELSQQSGIHYDQSGNPVYVSGYTASASQNVGIAAGHGGQIDSSILEPGTQELPYESLETDSVFFAHNEYQLPYVAEEGIDEEMYDDNEDGEYEDDEEYEADEEDSMDYH